MMGEEKGNASGESLQRIVQIFASDPSIDYAIEGPRMAETLALVRSIIADRLTGPLNKEIESRSQATLVDKQDLVRWVNSELRALGLAIRCPKTGKPAVLGADSGYRPSAGRFQIGLIERGNLHYQTKTVSSPKCLRLELMPYQGADSFQRKAQLHSSTPKSFPGR